MDSEFNEGAGEDVLKILTEVYEKSITIFGPDHPKTALVQFAIAIVFYGQGNFEKAMQNYKECFAKRVSSLGHNHPETLTVQNAIALIHGRKKEYNEALKIYKDVYAKRRVVLGATHHDTLCTRHNMAWVLSELGKDVLPVYEEIYNIMKKAHPDDPITLRVRCNIAVSLKKQGKYDAAVEVLNEIYDIQKRNDPKNPDALKTLEMILNVYTKQDNNTYVLETQRRIAEEKEILGSDK